MEVNDRKAAKSAIWYTVSNFLISGIGFITTPIFTRMMTKEDFGIISNYVAIASLIAIFVSLRLEASLIRAKYEFEDDFNNYIYSITVLSSTVAVIWLVFINIFPGFVSQITNIDILYLNLMALSLIISPSINFYQAKERYEFKYKNTVAISLTNTIFYAVLSIGLLFVFKDKVFARVLGAVIPGIVIGLAIYYVFFKSKYTLKCKYWKYALPICLPSIPHVLSLSMLSSFDRVMIMNYCGSAETALYSIASTCGGIISVIICSQNSAYAPWLGEQLFKDAFAKVRTVSRKYCLYFALLTIAFMLMVPEALLIIGGYQYMEAMYVMPPVIVGCFCQYVYTMYVSIEQFEKKTIGVAIVTVSCAAINYVLNMLFIPRYGYIAAAYTTLVSYFIMMMLHIIIVKKIGFSKFNDNKSIIAICLLLICFCGFASYIYTFENIRRVIGIAYSTCLLLFVYRNRCKLRELLR